MEERKVFLDGEKLLAGIKGMIESPIMPLGGDRSTYSGIGFSKSVATHVRDGLMGLTNRRVIFYMPKILNRYEFESYTIDQISSVQFTKGLHRGRIQVTAFNDYKIIKWISNEDGKRITEMIHNAVETIKGRALNKDTREVSKEENPLAVLKMRYARGEITKKKFDEMKKVLK